MIPSPLQQNPPSLQQNSPRLQQNSPTTLQDQGCTDSNAFYRLIQRVYLDLTESVRLQTLTSVKVALHNDPSTASYIAGTIASTQNALAAISAHIRSVTPYGGPAGDINEHMKWVLQQEELLAPGRDKELQACHRTLLHSMSRMSVWAHEIERPLIPRSEERTMAGSGDLDDITEVFRSPYARRQERLSRRALLSAVDDSINPNTAPESTGWGGKYSEKQNMETLRPTTSFGGYANPNVSQVSIVPYPPVPTPAPQESSPRGWTRISPVEIGEPPRAPSVLSSHGNATNTPAVELSNDVARELDSPPHLAVPELAASSASNSSRVAQSTNTSPVPQHLEAVINSALQPPSNKQAPPWNSKKEVDLQRHPGTSSIPPPVPPKDPAMYVVGTTSNAASGSLVPDLNHSPISQVSELQHSASWYGANTHPESISSLGAGSISMVSLQSSLPQVPQDSYRPGAYGAVEIDTMEVHRKQVPSTSENLPQPSGSASQTQVQQQLTQEQQRQQQEYQYQFQPQGFRQYYQNQSSPSSPPIAMDTQNPMPADSQYPIVVRSTSYARGAFRPALADENLPEVWIPGINPSPPVVDYSPTTGFPPTRGYPPNRRTADPTALSATATNSRNAQRARRVILEED
jgi:hypothetical protein